MINIMKWLLTLGLLLFSLSSALHASRPAEWQLVYSANLNGELKPCGCSAEGNLGGLLRRATQLEQLRRQNENTVVVSAGDLLGEQTEQGRIKNRFIIEGIAKLEFDAILPGERELNFSGFDRAALPWVLSNSSSYRSIAKYRTRTLGTGKRIVILGVVDPALSIGGATLEDPESSLDRQLAKLKPAPTDTVVVLVHGSDTLVQSLSKNTRINLLVRGHLDEPVTKSFYKTATGQPVLAAGHRGQRIGLAKFSTDAPSTFLDNEVIALPKTVIDHQDLAHLYAEYDAEIVKWFRGKALARRDALGKTKKEFASDQVCRQCHTATHRQWKKSRHANALQSLIKVSKHEDPECLACHTTGFGTTGGFISHSITPELANVQCEACHGAAQKHAEYPLAHQPWKAKGICGACHTPENSPSFNMATYWPRILHKQSLDIPVHQQAVSPIKGLYDVLDGRKPVLGSDPVEVVEFFNFYCSRCYILDKSWQDMTEFLQRPIKHIQVPIIFGDDQLPWAGIAWLAAEKSGKGHAFKHVVFEAKFKHNQDIGDKNVLLKIAAGIGIEHQVREAFSSNHKKYAAKFKQGMKRKQRLGVTVTPTLFINNNIRVLPGHTADNTQLQLENIREILLDIQCRQYQACDL